MTDLASLPVQLPVEPASTAAARARFFNSGNAFNVKLALVPAAQFGAVAAKELAPGAATGVHPRDLSAAIGCACPAITPLMLARYAVIRSGETLALDTHATGLLSFVLRGAGAAEAFNWRAGDVFLLPGGAVALHATEDAVPWLVGNEPLLAFEGLRPGLLPIAPVHHQPCIIPPRRSSGSWPSSAPARAMLARQDSRLSSPRTGLRLGTT